MIERRLRSAILILTGALAVTTRAAAQGLDSTESDSERETGFLPSIVFRPLIADPTEQQLGTSLRQGDFSNRGSLDGVASFGASLPILGFTAGKAVVQIGTAGGLIARFDMHTRANDIVSEDYELGFPVWIRSGRLGARLRVYHRSSHIGDEFVLNNPGFTRFDMTYEAVDAVVAASFAGSRIYAGGDYIYHNVTTAIEPGTLRAGADLISRSGFETRSLRCRWLAGIDLESARDLEWRTAKSAVAGLELSRRGTRSPSMRVLIELFDGTSTAGQFYGKSERYVDLAAYVTP